MAEGNKGKMAKEKKKTKIISERINTQFKEIKKEEKEEQLEEEVEEVESEEGAGINLRVRELAAPVLEAGEQVQETERREERENTPIARANARGEESYVINMPVYSQDGNYETIEQERREERRDREMNVTSMQPRHEQVDNTRKINVNAWMGEMEHPETRKASQEYSVRMRKEAREEGLPFEDKRRKRIGI